MKTRILNNNSNKQRVLTDEGVTGFENSPWNRFPRESQNFLANKKRESVKKQL